MEEKEDKGALKAVKVISSVLPLMFRLGWVYLKLKRKQKKRIKIFVKTLQKEGMDRETAERLSSEIPELSLRDMMGEFSGGDMGIPKVSDFIGH
ncbi:MAG: hypothetical protein ACQESD_03035 [Thermoplasmatota archaeon]